MVSFNVLTKYVCIVCDASFHTSDELCIHMKYDNSKNTFSYQKWIYDKSGTGMVGDQLL